MSREPALESLDERRRRVSAGSPRLMTYLRYPGDERQLTYALAGLAADEPEFAAKLARAFVRPATETPQGARARRLLARIPDAMSCNAEEPWRGRDGKMSFLDLRFTSQSPRIELVVEAKIGTEYGSGQLSKYLHTRPRALLLGVTPTGPLGDEPPATERRWLGSVRWSAVLHEFCQVAPSSQDLGAQWRAFVAVLGREEDLVPPFDAGCVLKDPSADDALDQLGLLLEREATRVLGDVRSSVPKAFGSPYDRVRIFTSGRRGVFVAQRGRIRRLGFCVPANNSAETVGVDWDAYYGTAELSVWFTRQRDVGRKLSALRAGFEQTQPYGHFKPPRNAPRDSYDLWVRRYTADIAKEVARADDPANHLYHVVCDDLRYAGRRTLPSPPS